MKNAKCPFYLRFSLFNSERGFQSNAKLNHDVRVPKDCFFHQVWFKQKTINGTSICKIQFGSLIATCKVPPSGRQRLSHHQHKPAESQSCCKLIVPVYCRFRFRGLRAKINENLDQWPISPTLADQKAS